MENLFIIFLIIFGLICLNFFAFFIFFEEHLSILNEELKRIRKILNKKVGGK